MPAKKKPASKKTGKRKLGWIAYVKKYAKDHKIDYGEAMSTARASYYKQ